MNAVIIALIVFIACFGYIAWSISAINNSNKKLKQATQKANEQISALEKNAQVLKDFARCQNEIDANIDQLKKDVDNAQTEQDVSNIISNVIASNNERVSNGAKH